MFDWLLDSDKCMPCLREMEVPGTSEIFDHGIVRYDKEWDPNCAAKERYTSLHFRGRIFAQGESVYRVIRYSESSIEERRLRIGIN